MGFENNLTFAKKMDEQDPLKDCANQFHKPIDANGNPLLYFTGNSLGLQPKTAQTYVLQELEDWKNLGSKGHLQAKRPWVNYHRQCKKALAMITGSLESEVVAMNSLTINLHLLMVSFYRPTQDRYKIVMLKNAFPSDQYAIQSQVKFHGYDPQDAIIHVGPEGSEGTLDPMELKTIIHEQGDSIALVLIEGVSYLTGQLFDISSLSSWCNEKDIVLGLDLAHAVGNVPLQLHKDQVDFAVWCSYKYLNGGPGCVGGAFVHQKHESSFDLSRFSGWWGHNEERRFLMEKNFDPMKGVDGWQLSNVPVLVSAALLSSLDLFMEVGMERLFQKSKQLTNYLEYLLHENCAHFVRIITPKNEPERGCQLSLQVQGGKQIFETLMRRGVVCDWREPNVIRLAPVPLYNQYQEVFQFVQILKEAFHE